MVAIAPLISLNITPVYGESTRPLAIIVNGEGSPMPQLDAKLQQLEAEVWDITAMNAVGGETLPTRWTVKNRNYPGTVLWLEGQNALNQIPSQRPVWIIGRGSAAQAMLQLLPRIERRIQFVAMVDLPLTSAMEKGNQDASNSANNLDNVDVFLNYFQLPQAIAAPRRKADDCDSVNCYEFDGRGDRLTAEDWIQGDLVFQLNNLLNAGKPEPITIILTVNQPPASP